MVHMEADAGKTRSSCRYPVRCAVAAVMTVLIVAITLNTVKLILYQRSHQHDPFLSLSVARGLVYVKRAAAAATHPPALLFYLGVRVSNARGNDGFRYYAADMTACLFDENTAADAPERDAIFCFHQGPFIKAVVQQARHYFLMEAKGTRGGTMNSSHFDHLYKKGGSLDGVALRLEGTFVAERSSRWNYTTSRDINYDCEALSISGPEADEDELLDRHCATVIKD